MAAHTEVQADCETEGYFFAKEVVANAREGLNGGGRWFA